MRKLVNEYKTFPIKDSSECEQYKVPYISLYFDFEKKREKGEYDKPCFEDFCKTKATVKVLINADNITKIEFSCEDSLTVEPKELNNIPNGKSVQRITIRHNYAFSDKHQSVKAFAYHKDGKTKTFAGQINVVKCEPKKVNICFVNVKRKHKGSITLVIPDKKFSNTQQDNLRRFLSQAQVIPQFTTETLDFGKSAVPDAMINVENCNYTPEIDGAKFVTYSENI